MSRPAWAGDISSFDGVDVLVVGGGNAALVAALEARGAGAKVVVLERAEPEWRGGNSKYTRNIRCAHEGIAGGPAYTEQESDVGIEVPIVRSDSDIPSIG